MNKILLVEDELEIREEVAELLRQGHFLVHALESGESLMQELSQFEPNLLLLDYRLPGRDGVALLRSVRSNKEFRCLPIIMLTGVNGEDQKVAALDLGADDYVEKPFSPRELVARVKAVLRRAECDTDEEGSDILEFKDLKVDLSSHKAELKGQELPLTLTEFRILVELMRQKGKVLSRDRLRANALGNLNVSDRTIDVHMASLRKKIEPLSRQIRTVRGVGYRMAESERGS